MNQQLMHSEVLELFQTSKTERELFVNEIIERLESGEISPLKTHLQVKAMEEIITRLTDKKKYPNTAAYYCAAVLQEAESNGKAFELFNAKFSIKETGTAYNFSLCNDPELIALEKEFNSVKAALDARKEFLKSLSSKGLTVVDETSGEIYTVYPPSKSSTTSVTVTLK